MIRLLATLLLALVLAGPAAAAEPPPFVQQGEPASFDLLGGGSRAGAGAGGVSGGWPWASLRAQVGGGAGVTPLVVLDAAIFRRWEPMAGVSGRIVDGARGRLSGELLVGWTVQTGVLARHGPRVTGRVRLMAIPGRLAPWLAVATGHTLYVHRTDRDADDGVVASRTVSHEWAPVIEAGLAIGITKHVGLDVGVDLRFVGAPHTIALPGFHLGVQFGGGR